MLEFHPLQLEDLPKLRDFFAYSGSRICDTTPGTVFMWRDMYHTEWAVHDGSLYFKVDYPGLGPTFTLPLGGGRPEHYRQIAGYCCRRGMPISFYPVPKDELDLGTGPDEHVRLPDSFLLLDQEGEDITQEYEDPEIDQSWGAGTGTAERFLLYVLIGLSGLIGFAFVRFFLL